MIDQNYECSVQNYECSVQNYESSVQNYECSVQNYEKSPSYILQKHYNRYFEPNVSNFDMLSISLMFILTV